MTSGDRELSPILRRAIDELRRLPPVDAAAVRHVVDAAAAARLTPADDESMIPPRRPRRMRGGAWSVAVLTAAAAVIGFVARGAWTARSRLTGDTLVPHPVAPQAQAVRPAAMSDRDVLPIPYLFVFNDRRAHRVAVVGDFNQWNGTRAPMTRAPDGDLWSVTIPIVPGRHTYGFMIDDSLLVLDPRAPKARDPDLGAEGSVVIVGRP
jgi:hypothetical protein